MQNAVAAQADKDPTWLIPQGAKETVVATWQFSETRQRPPHFTKSLRSKLVSNSQPPSVMRVVSDRPIPPFPGI